MYTLPNCSYRQAQKGHTIVPSVRVNECLYLRFDLKITLQWKLCQKAALQNAMDSMEITKSNVNRLRHLLESNDRAVLWLLKQTKSA